METDTMGRVLTEATIRESTKISGRSKRVSSDQQVRRVTLHQMHWSIPAPRYCRCHTQMIRQLGLEKSGSKRVTSSTGGGEADLYSAVRLTIQGRSCTMDVMEVPDTCRLSSAKFRSSTWTSSSICGAAR